MKYIKLYENWRRPQMITLTSRIGNIILSIEHGNIKSIENNTEITPNFTEGQPLQLPFIRGWASRHGFKVEDSNQPSEDKKIFGINTKHISNSDPLRWIYPGKFK